MADVVALPAEAVRETFPNVSINDLRYSAPWIDTRQAILVVAYACLFIIGTTSNFYVAGVVVSILRFNNAQTPRTVRIFVLALCCCDLLVLAFLPFLLFDLIYNQWAVPGSAVLCQLYLSSESVNKLSSPFLLVAMSAFCYMKICRPSASDSFRQLSSASESARGFSVALTGREFYVPLLVVFTCVVLAFGLATPIYVYGDLYYVVLYNQSMARLIMVKCAFHPPDNVLTIFTIYCFIFGYVIPAGSFTVFYLAVVFRVKQQNPLLAPSAFRTQPSQMGQIESDSQTNRNVSRHGSGRSRRLERATRTCVGLVLFYLACWTPYWAMNLKNYFLVPIDETDGTYHPNDMEAVAGYVIHMLPYICCSGYPILHAILNRNIRRDCKLMKDKRKRRKCRQMALEKERRSGGQATTQLCSGLQDN